MDSLYRIGCRPGGGLVEVQEKRGYSED